MFAVSSSSVDVDVDLKENVATTTIHDELFEDGTLELADYHDGWEGFERVETSEGEIQYFYVNTRSPREAWIKRVRVGERAVRMALVDRLEYDAGRLSLAEADD